MTYAICLSCGAPKREPWAKCRECSFNPQKDQEALVKSVYLSVGRFEDADDREAYRMELSDAAERIAAGEDLPFDEDELARLRAQHNTVSQLGHLAPWKAVLRFFLPGIALLIVLFGLVYIVRLLK